ncbi:hypothetical protein HPP92_004037 [Vanilla planifolia]|uniref:non-specific serine/threonine protein kinase n=1 Tax=Vanilla planifolia TaxID=51239 RepID=A0A835VJZ8_VANPL|nr:hypothetical protein HPP92_004037 [Vanilla planifolia]
MEAAATAKGGPSTAEKKGSILMRRYEMGRVVGQGTFAKVYHARSLATGQSVAIKVIDKEKVLRVGMIDQIEAGRSPSCGSSATQTLCSSTRRSQGDGLRPQRPRRHTEHDGLPTYRVARRPTSRRRSSTSGATTAPRPTSGPAASSSSSSSPDSSLPRLQPHGDVPPRSTAASSDAIGSSPTIAGLLSRLLDQPLHPHHHRKARRAPWFKGFKPVQAQMQDGRVPDDVDAFFSTGTAAQDEEEEKKKNKKVIVRPASFNAFDIISLSKGFDLSGLFDGCGERRYRRRAGSTQKPAATIVSPGGDRRDLEELPCKRKEDGTVKLQGRKEEEGPSPSTPRSSK